MYSLRETPMTLRFDLDQMNGRVKSGVRNDMNVKVIGRCLVDDVLCRASLHIHPPQQSDVHASNHISIRNFTYFSDHRLAFIANSRGPLNIMYQRRDGFGEVWEGAAEQKDVNDYLNLTNTTRPEIFRRAARRCDTIRNACSNCAIIFQSNRDAEFVQHGCNCPDTFHRICRLCLQQPLSPMLPCSTCAVIPYDIDN